VSEAKTPEMKTFETQRYRVVGVGAICQKVSETLDPDGQIREVLVPTLALRGEVVDLPEFEAKRLLALSAVKPVEEPRVSPRRSPRPRRVGQASTA
jgi:hypothetical protein